MTCQSTSDGLRYYISTPPMFFMNGLPTDQLPPMYFSSHTGHMEFVGTILDVIATYKRHSHAVNLHRHP